MAEELLKHNDKNRPLDFRHIESLVSDLKAGRWHYTGDTIKIGKDGHLMDGQHRLWAIAQSGVSMELTFAVDLEPEAMPCIDVGKVRSMGNILGIEGVPNAVLVAGMLRMMMWYETARAKGLSYNTFRPTKPEIESHLKQFPGIIESATTSRGYSKFGLLATPVIAGFTMYYAEKINAHKATKFGEAMHSGLELTVSSPMYVLREKLQHRKSAGRHDRNVSTLEVAAWCVKGFNAFAKNRTIRAIRWQPGEDFPEFGKP